MATLMTITGTTAQGQLIVDAMCDVYKYQALLEDGDGTIIPNPETRNQFARRQVRDFIRNIVVKHKADQAEVERLTLIAEAETLSSGIENI